MIALYYIEDDPGIALNVKEYLEQVCKQLLRLTHLEEALLVLSRIDAEPYIYRGMR